MSTQSPQTSPHLSPTQSPRYSLHRASHPSPRPSLRLSLAKLHRDAPNLVLSDAISPPLEEVLWVPNDLVDECYQCDTPFTITNRKHHCRECGNIFCDKCSAQRIVLHGRNSKEPVRVCEACYGDVQIRASLDKQSANRGTPTHSNEKEDTVLQSASKEDMMCAMKLQFRLHQVDEITNEEMKLYLSQIICFNGDAKNAAILGGAAKSSSDSSTWSSAVHVASPQNHLQSSFPLSFSSTTPTISTSVAPIAASRSPLFSPSSYALVSPFVDLGTVEHSIQIEGTLILTNYRLCFLARPVKEHNSSDNDKKSGAASKDRYSPLVIEVPLMAIEKVATMLIPDRDLAVIELPCKDFRSLHFGFLGLVKNQSYAGFRTCVLLLKYYVQTAKISNLFAFKYKIPESQPPAVHDHSLPENGAWHVLDSGWRAFDFEKEYQRLGIPGSGWRLSHMNRHYSLCPTYPSILVVPESIPDSFLTGIASFRSKKRIPVLSWKNPNNNTVLLRSAQPLVGIMGTRCEEDEKYICAAVNSSDSQDLLIVDARPTVNAVAQTAMGGGYESPEIYQKSGDIQNCQVQFIGIDNIHMMRKSYQSLRKLCIQLNETGDDSTWWSSLANTNHMHHISAILSGTITVVNALRQGISVLVHCTDGWDRTAQLASLAQLILDPYYRTLEGFQMLIEKEWLAFGFKFLDRTGHGRLSSSANEIAPIFPQWIDCVWQLLDQFPSAFEFNEDLLIFILDQLHSCKYGNFLYNCEMERKQAFAERLTPSIWDDIYELRAHFLNPDYVSMASPTAQEQYKQPSLDRKAASPRQCKPPMLTVDDIRKSTHKHILLPNMKKIRFWANYYLRWEPLGNVDPRRETSPSMHNLSQLQEQTKQLVYEYCKQTVIALMGKVALNQHIAALEARIHTLTEANQQLQHGNNINNSHGTADSSPEPQSSVQFIEDPLADGTGIIAAPFDIHENYAVSSPLQQTWQHPLSPSPNPNDHNENNEQTFLDPLYFEVER